MATCCQCYIITAIDVIIIIIIIIINVTYMAQIRIKCSKFAMLTV